MEAGVRVSFTDVYLWEVLYYMVFWKGVQGQYQDGG